MDIKSLHDGEANHFFRSGVFRPTTDLLGSNLLSFWGTQCGRLRSATSSSV